jgi:hypothetical protein
MSKVNILKIKRSWNAGVESGNFNAAYTLDPTSQSIKDGLTWQTIADDEFDEDKCDVKEYPHVYMHGFLYGYYSSCSEDEILPQDREAYELAKHMAERMSHLL